MKKIKNNKKIRVQKSRMFFSIVLMFFFIWGGVFGVYKSDKGDASLNIFSDNIFPGASIALASQNLDETLAKIESKNKSEESKIIKVTLNIFNSTLLFFKGLFVGGKRIVTVSLGEIFEKENGDNENSKGTVLGEEDYGVILNTNNNSSLTETSQLSVNTNEVGAGSWNISENKIVISNGSSCILADLVSSDYSLNINNENGIIDITSFLGNKVDISGETNLKAGSGLRLEGDSLRVASSIARDSELHNALTLSGEADYLTLVGQEIVRNLIDLNSHVTGVLSIANGGTGVSDGSPVFNNLSLNGTFSILESGLNPNYSTIFRGANQNENIIYTLPSDSPAGNNYVLTAQTDGTLAWSSVSGTGGVSGIGTAGQVAYWSDASTITGENYLSVSRGGTGANTLNDLIILGTHTIGNYVATISGNSQIGVSGAGAENSIASLLIIDDSIGNAQLAYDTGQNLTTASSPAFSGLTLSSLTGGSIPFIGTGGNLIQDNGNLFWDDVNRRLGIGTITPVTSLDVRGNVSIPQNNALFFSSIIAQSRILQDNLSTLQIYGASGLNFKTFSSSWMDRLTINSGGNVGIGTTSPNVKLDVRGNLQIGNSGIVGSTNWPLFISDSSGLGWKVADGTGNTKFELYAGNGGINEMRIFNGVKLIGYGQDLTMGTSNYTSAMTIQNSTGNVGIGTTNPGALLDVSGSSGNLFRGQNGSTQVFSVGSTGNFWLKPSSAATVPFTITGALDQTGHLFDINSDGSTGGNLMTILSNGNVGIGTTTPASKLQILSATEQLRLSYNSTNYASFTVNNQGYISVGGTLGRFDSLNAYANLSFVSPGSIANTNTGGGTGMSIIGSGSTSGFLNLKSTSGNAIGDYVKITGGNNGGTEIARFLGSGNVGIGTTSPLEKLQVNGKILVNNGSLLYIDSNTGGSTWANSGALPMVFNTNSANQMVIGANGTVTLTQNLIVNGIGNTTIAGNVGIGTTSPGNHLHIQGTGNQFLEVESNNASTAALMFKNTVGEMYAGINGAGNFSIRNVQDILNGTLLTVKSTGNVGIGTTNPTAKLELYDPVNGGVNNAILKFNKGGQISEIYHNDTGARLTLKSSIVTILNDTVISAYFKPVGLIMGSGKSIFGENETSYLNLSEGGSGDFKLFANPDKNIRFGNGAIERMRIDAFGNVGIGLTNPAYKLDVLGDANVSGTLTVGTLTATNLSSASAISAPYFTATDALGTSSFAGGISISGNIIPTSDNTYSLGSATNMWKDVYIGPGSLYVNGKKVIQEASESMVFTADLNQNLIVQTSGSGDIELNPVDTGMIQLKGNVQLTAGKTFRTSTGVPINFSDGIFGGNLSLAGNLLSAANTNGSLELSANGLGAVYVTTGNFGVGTTAPLEKLDVAGRLHLAQTTAPSTVTDRLYNVGGSLYWNGVDVSSGGTGATQWTTSGTNIYYNGGNVGIGTTSPGYPLYIQPFGVSNGWTAFDATSDNSPRIRLQSATITRSTSGGIIIDEVAGAANGKLQVAGNIIINGQQNRIQLGSGSGNASIATNWNTADTRITVENIGTRSSILSIKGGLTVGTNYISNTPTAEGVLIEGNVGIGTTNPLEKLDVSGSIRAANEIRVGAGSVAYSSFSFSSDVNTGMYLPASDNIGLTTGGVERLRINNLGNVGIGTTTPGQLLSVSGIAADLTTSLVSITNTASGAGSASIKFLTRNTTSGGPYTTGRIMSVFDGTTFADARISLQTPTASDIWVDALTAKNGNVGIGTTTPAYKLDVRGLASNDVISTDIGLNLNPVTNPSSGSLQLLASAGNVTAGTHYYWVTYATAIGETGSYNIGSVTTDSTNGQVMVTIPTSPDPRVTSRKIYRTKANSPSYETWSLITVNNNIDTTYVDNIADNSLTGVSAGGYYQINTTNKGITVAGGPVMRMDRMGTSFGLEAGGGIVGGGNNTLFGYGAGKYITSGNQNTFMGTGAGGMVTTGSNNIAVGQSAGQAIGTGSNNILIGRNSGANINSSSGSNVVIGSFSFNLGTPSAKSANTGLGYGVGSNNAGNYNTFLGYYAGSHETGSNTLIIDNIGRTSEALGRSEALIYGVTNTTPANQILSLGGGGNVGIGTTSPEDLLHVYGANPSYKLTDSSTGSFYIDADYSSGGVDRLWSDTNNLRIGTESAAKYIDFYTVNSQKVRITADGNVGIGTTTPGAKLDVVGDLSLTGIGAIGNSTYTSVPLQIKSDNINSGRGIWIEQGNDPVYGFLISQEASTAKLVGVNSSFLIEGSRPVTIQSGGGPWTAGVVLKTISAQTNSGASVAEINGNLSPISGTLYPKVLNISSTFDNSGGTHVGGYYGIDLNVNDFNGVVAADSALLRLRNNNTTRFVVSPNGNVGIGTTNPGSLLTIAQNSTTSGLRLIESGGTGRIADLYIDSGGMFVINRPSLIGNLSFNNNSISGNGATSSLTQIGGSTTNEGGKIVLYGSSNAIIPGAITFLTGASGLSMERMRIDNAGNVGIGTTTPSSAFHIYEPVAGVNKTMTFSNPTVTGIFGLVGLGSSLGFGSVSNDDVIFYSNNAERFKIKGDGTAQFNGNVGIGTTTPSAQLTLIKADSSALTDFLINPTAKTSGNLIDAQVGGVSKFNVTNTGIVNSAGTFVSSANIYAYGNTIGGGGGILNIRGGQANAISILDVKHTNDTPFNLSAGNQYGLRLLPVYNQVSSTAANTDLLINRTETSIGSGAQYLIDAQVGGTSKFNITNTGNGYFAGNVGIGTTIPTSKLDIIENDISSLTSAVTIAQNFVSANDGKTVLTLNRNTSGSASPGIGSLITFQVESASGSYTNVGQIGAFLGSSMHDGDGFGIITNGSKNLFVTKSGRTALGGMVNPGSILSVKGSTSIGSNYALLTAPTNGLIVEGNVGIGTTSPESNLDIRSIANVAITLGRSDFPTYSTRLLSNFSASDTFVLRQGTTYSTDILSFSAVGGDLKLMAKANDAAGTAGNILFHTGTGEKVRIASSGNVGIGITSPTNALEVNGNIQSGAYKIAGATILSGSVNVSLGSIGSTNDIQLKTVGGTGLYVGNTGNVGIGTTSPETKLDVNGDFTFRGNVLTGTDNSYDIGASGSKRPRTGYFGTSVVAPTFTATTSVSTVNATISGALTLTNPIQNYNAFTGWKVFDSIGTNLLAGKATKLKISFDGVDSPVSTYQQTTQNFEGSGNAIRGNDGDADHVIDVDLVTNGLYGTNGVTYSSGKVVLSFYQYGPANITARVKDKNGTWTAMTMTRDNVYATSWTGIIPIQNYLTNLEFTISTGTGAPYVTGLTKWSLTQIEYYANRMTLAQGGLLTSIGGFLGGNMTIGKGVNVLLDDITGTKIGTGTTQKLGFWNATPIVQPANTVAIDTLLENTGLRAGGGYANFDDNVGIGTTTPGAKLDIGLAGTSLGTLRLAGNTSGYVQIQPAAAAGSWTMILPGAVGSAGQQLTDVNGDGVTSWAAAGSLRSLKNIDNQIIDPGAALNQIVNTPIYNFHYKKGMGTGDSDTQYVGVMADEAAWAMHYDGNVINPVNTLGYMVLGVKALDNKINLQNQNITETQSIASILGEQNSVETRLIASIEETINNQDLRIIDSENKINELETQTQNLASLLQAQIAKLEELSNQELNFAWADLFASILNIDGNRVDILNIRDFSAEMTETGVMVIKVNDNQNATIGTAVICPALKELDENGQCSIEQIDTNNDNIDDNTGKAINNGKSATIKTGAVKNSSKVFVTIKSKLTKEATLMVTEIKEGESFNVELVNPTDEDVTFDWWIVEMK